MTPRKILQGWCARMLLSNDARGETPHQENTTKKKKPAAASKTRPGRVVLFLEQEGEPPLELEAWPIAEDKSDYTPSEFAEVVHTRALEQLRAEKPAPAPKGKKPAPATELMRFTVSAFHGEEPTSSVQFALKLFRGRGQEQAPGSELEQGSVLKELHQRRRKRGRPAKAQGTAIEAITENQAALADIMAKTYRVLLAEHERLTEKLEQQEDLNFELRMLMADIKNKKDEEVQVAEKSSLWEDLAFAALEIAQNHAAEQLKASAPHPDPRGELLLGRLAGVLSPFTQERLDGFLVHLRQEHGEEFEQLFWALAKRMEPAGAQEGKG